MAAFVEDTTPWTGGKVTQRSWCVLGNNASPMTYTGTNTWILHEPESQHALVVDPAPAGTHIKHIQQVCADLGVSIAAILLTHTHFDHTEGAADLALATGAPIFVHNVQAYRDYVQEQLSHGEIEAADSIDNLVVLPLEVGEFGETEVFGKLADSEAFGKRAESEGHGKLGRSGGLEKIGESEKLEGFEEGNLPQLSVITLSGHSSDSVALLYKADRSLLVGDVVFRHGPTVVYHPDGILKDYLDSLDTLERIAQDGSVERFLPGHGYPITNMVSCIEATRQHRLVRLQQIEDALEAGIAPAADPLVDAIYRDTDARLRPAALKSVQAQLMYLGFDAGDDLPDYHD